MGLCLKQLNNLWGEPINQKKINLANQVGPVCTDSRQVVKGSFFVPLVGERFDGHNFLSEVFEQGAQAAVIAKEFETKIPSTFLHWVVEDTLLAYQELALLHRTYLSIPVIAITGSVGKTTTKEIVKAILNPFGSIAATFGNNNNDIGVPRTLLEATQEDSAIVVEMGMRGFGEIKRLSCCSKPDIAVITNIGSSHIGILGSRRNIALAKCEITSYLKPSGSIVIPGNDALLEEILRSFWKGKLIRVAIDEDLLSNSKSSQSNHSLKSSEIDFHGHVDLGRGLLEVENKIFKLPLEGKHNAMNYMLALAVAKELGIDLEEIKNFTMGALPGRNSIFKSNGITILDETYNSSPESVKASLELLVRKEGRHFAVIGTMRELGDYSVSLHREIGKLIVELSLDGLIIVADGLEAKAMATACRSLPCLEVVSKAEEAFEPLISWLKPGDIVLLKASRDVELERLFVLLKNYL